MLSCANEQCSFLLLIMKLHFMVDALALHCTFTVHYRLQESIQESTSYLDSVILEGLASLRMDTARDITVNIIY